MVQVSDELLAKLRILCAEKGDDSGILLNELVQVVEEHLNKRNNEIYHEIKSISNRIDEAKADFTRPSSEDAVSDAQIELDAVVKSTEEATHTILDMAEHIQGALARIQDKELAGAIQNDVSKIFEACNFQDLTGQRISKVATTLQFVEDAVGNLLRALAKSIGEDMPINESDSLKNGPQADSSAPTQEDIDRLFDQA